MKIALNKKEIQSAIHTLIKAIPTRTTLPILSCALFEAKGNQTIIRGTNLEITIISKIPTSVEEEGLIAIPIQKLLNIITELPEEKIKISSNDKNKITISSSLGSYSLMGKATDEFPAPPETQERALLSINKKTLLKIIKKTAFVISTDDLKPSITGLLLKIENNKITAVATDGHRLARYVFNDYSTDQFLGEVIIPRKFLKLLELIISENEKTQVWIGKNHATAEGENTTIITKIIDEKYPDYDSVIPRENKKVLVANKERLYGAVKRVSIFSNKMTQQVSITAEKNLVSINTEDPETSSSGQEEMEGSYLEEALTIGFNANYLKDILSHIDGEKVVMKMDTPIGATLFEEENQDKQNEITMLLMPIRLNN